MATEVIHSIKASGGDYTTLEAWRDAQVRDLVAVDEIEVAEIYDDFGVNGVTTANFVLGATPWTTDSARYVHIRAAVGAEFDFSTKSGAHIRNTSTASYSRVIDSDNTYTILSNLGIIKDGTNTSGTYCVYNPIHYTIKQCYLETAGQPIRLNDSGLVQTCVFLSTGTAVSVVGTTGYKTHNIINCTLVGGTYAVNNSTSTWNIKNCVAYSQATAGFNISKVGTSTNNAAWDASTNTPPGSNPLLTDVTAADFADAANDDYHLSSGSILRGAGANLSADYPGMLDMDGDSFPSSGAWDIGADYYVSAGTGISPASELDTASALSGYKQSALSSALELDSALTLSSQVATPISAATELDAGTALVGYKQQGLAVANELDAALAVSGSKYSALIPSFELNNSLALSGYKSSSLLPSVELDLALPLVASAVTPIYSANELDYAQQVIGYKEAQVQVSIEFDAAFPLASSVGISPAIELDVGQSILGTKQSAVAPASELDYASFLSSPIEIISAVELDTGQTLQGTKQASVTPAVEIDLAAPLSEAGKLSPASELDVAISLKGAYEYQLVPALELDQASILVGDLVNQVHPAAEVDNGQAISGRKEAGISLSTELDTATSLLGVKSGQILPGSSKAYAQSLIGWKQQAVFVGIEQDRAIGLGSYLSIYPAIELDSALPVGVKKYWERVAFDASIARHIGKSGTIARVRNFTLGA